MQCVHNINGPRRAASIHHFREFSARWLFFLQLFFSPSNKLVKSAHQFYEVLVYRKANLEDERGEAIQQQQEKKT